jgi:uncharacterized protein
VAPALIVIAKAPVPGRVKTRLTPPCTPVQAAALACAALQDTLDAAARAALAGRRVIVLDGEPGSWVPAGFEVIAQRGDGLDERLAAALEDVGEAAFLVGMDTPQVTPALLDAGLAGVTESDSAFGAALDGGYWAIGLRRSDARAFAGVPMSTPHTGSAQLLRLRALGMRTAALPALRDVDTMDDARRVAREAPSTGFARAVRALSAHTTHDEQPVPEAARRARFEVPYR